MELQDVLRVVLAEHVGEVRGNHQQEPAPRQKRQREHARDDDGHRQQRRRPRQRLEDGSGRHVDVGVQADQPAVVHEIRVSEIAQVLLDDACPNQEPPSREVEDEPPVLADRRCSVDPHQQCEDADRVDLVLFAAQHEQAENPHRDAMAADPSPRGEQGERESHVFRMEEIAGRLLDRRPERDGGRQRDGEPGRRRPIARQK